MHCDLASKFASSLGDDRRFVVSSVGGHRGFGFVIFSKRAMFGDDLFSNLVKTTYHISNYYHSLSQAMVNFVSLDHLSLQFKVYLLILHTVVLCLIVHALVTVFLKSRTKDKDGINISQKQSSGVRTVHVDGKRVTVESCEWINSMLNWLHMNASSTPDLLKIWLTMLNEKLKNDKSSLKCKINGIVPGSLPPRFTNVYCSNVSGNVQCIALHIETTRLGFYISLSDNNDPPAKPSDVEVNITKLSGELVFQVLARQSHYDLTVKFIGDPQLEVSSNDISEDSDRSAVEERLKEVICKTVVNVPLTDGKPSDEISGTSLTPQISSSCVDLEGKLLVKVIKATGLTAKDEKDTPDAYCVLTCKEPMQKKRTTPIKGSKDPFWNESHVLDISKKTTEITFDLYDALKTPEETKFHLNDYSGKSNNTDSDFLGQAIVPLAMIGKDQPCRLILPVLPISMESRYVTGQITLEFTYDTEGKEFATFTPSQSVSSKDDAETTPTASKNLEGKETIQVSPQQNVISMATLDIIEDDDGQLHFEPVEDHGIGREDIVMAEQRISEGLLVTNSDVTVSGNEEISLSTGDNEKYSEILQELIELDTRSTAHDRLENEEKPGETELKDNGEKPLSQRTRTKQTTSPQSVAVPPPPHEPSISPTSPVDAVEGVVAADVDEKSMEDLTPNTRRKLFRKAFSMRINRNHQPSAEEMERKGENSKPSPASLLNPADIPTSRSKAGSQTSLSSLYEGTKSMLVVETRDRGQVKYYQIPPLMAKRGTFDHKGTKLHICNDHLFVATHFSGSLPSCSVCKSSLTGYFGKQGYRCRDCQMVTHKRCHLEINSLCPKSSLPSLKIVTLVDEPE